MKEIFQINQVNSVEYQKYASFFKTDTYPSINILEPITGYKEFQLNITDVDEEEFFDKIIKFLSEHQKQ